MVVGKEVGMKYILIIIIVLFSIILWSIINDKNRIKKIKNQLKNEWGKVPDEEYISEKFESLKSYYLSNVDDRLDVDDITWNDLDLDQIYMMLNNTSSAIGEEYLYALLRKPCFSSEELTERNRLIKFFGTNEEKRISLQLKLSQMGKLRSISVFEYINRLGEQKAQNNLIHYLMAGGLVLSLLYVFVNPGLGGICTVVFIANNIIRYYKRKAQIDSYLTVFSYIIRLLDSVKGITKLDIPEIKIYNDMLKNDSNIFKKFKKGSRMLVTKNTSGNFMDIFIDYFRMLFHVDLIKFNSMLNFLNSRRETLNRIFVNVGYLDSMIAAASFREMMDYYCEPELSKDGKPNLQVTDLYHPLIDHPVTNSINEDQCILITGSNASGKSTFIKTLAINTILSQTIYTSLSTSYKASFFQIYSSMALRDNIFTKESYYIVEIKSLKRILDRVNNDIPTLCFVDEVLRGTNTLERIAASSRILETLAKRNTLVCAATHDIELTHILGNFYSNYHFQERILDHEIIFDYKLHQGKAVSKNAIKLLGILGYPADMIEDAEKAADDFLTNGEWKQI